MIQRDFENKRAGHSPQKKVIGVESEIVTRALHALVGFGLSLDSDGKKR